MHWIDPGHLPETLGTVESLTASGSGACDAMAERG
jgi:hypothetical protein